MGSWRGRFAKVLGRLAAGPDEYRAGLVVNPRGVYHGFMRGRTSSNLYSAAFSDELLNSSVGDTRHRLGVDNEAKPASFRDKAVFVFWIAVSASVYLVAVLLPLSPLILIGSLVY